ncbi:MAG: peptidase S41, partial [Bacteroidota bacterium]
TEDIKRQIELLKTQVQHCREKDLQRFKQEIKLALQEAIVARYYFQEGVIEALLSHDQNIQKACTFFQDMSQYYSLLKAAE